MTLPSIPRLSPAQVLERLLFGVGALCLGAALVGWAEGLLFQRLLDWRLERALGEGAGQSAPSLAVPALEHAGTPAAPARAAAEAPGEPDDAARPRVADPFWTVHAPPASSPDSGRPIGRLTSRRLGLSAVVAEGISARTLRRAVGHIPGTALPWEDGNVGLAAHRDTFFWRLRDVKVGDTFRLATPRGSFEYVVRSLHVVSPERADLLEPSSRPTLTLVTCYPFSMVGPAPSRFVVTAERVDDVAAAAPAPPRATWVRYPQQPGS